MTWADAKAALALLAEERLGRVVREHEATEEAQYQRSLSVLRQGTRAR